MESAERGWKKVGKCWKAGICKGEARLVVGPDCKS